MKRVGLQPSSTGQPGGKETGQRVADYAITAGPFEMAFDRWMKLRPMTLYADLAAELKDEKTERAKTKIKYTCPGCDVNAWGKRGLNLVCGDCEETMEADEPEETSEVEEGGDE